MSSDFNTFLGAAGQVLEKVPEVYDDGIKSTVKQTGGILELIPRTIRAALMPIEKWVMDREYERRAYEETQILLIEKLKNTDPEKIVPPEPYVAVPVLRAIAYSMDSKELRDMYANLLARAMYVDTKDCVHPSFVEIVKQMSPHDAQNLYLFIPDKELPIAEYRLTHYEDGFNRVVFDVLLSNAFIDNPYFQDLQLQSLSITNLNRLGLINTSYTYTVQDAEYERFKEHDYCDDLLQRYNVNTIAMRRGMFAATNLEKTDPNDKILEIVAGISTLSPLGKTFVEICISPLPHSFEAILTGH